MMPCHVLHTLGSAQFGVSTSFVRIISGLAKGLDPERYCMHACFFGENGPLVSQLEEAGVSARAIGWGGFRRDPTGALRFWNVLRSQDWAVIHVHAGGKSLRWLARAASRASIVVHLHALNTSDTDPEGYDPVPKQLSDADVVIANSQAVAELVLGPQPHVVYAGVRVPEDSGGLEVRRTMAGRVIGTACRLVPIKGTVYLIRAIALLRAQVPDVSLEIAGLGPERAHLENEVRLLGLTDHVRFLGWQENVEALMSRWDIFAMPSLQEAFGIAALEAMAAGLPVVATAVGGVPELVQDGRTGWLVPPADPAALAERLRALLIDRELRIAMGAAGYARARNCFSMDRMVAGIGRIYDGIVGMQTE